jgi:hypothetical protein
MHLAHYLGLLHRSEAELAEAFRAVARGHDDEPDVVETCELLAAQCDVHVDRLAPVVERYGEQADDEPERLHGELFRGTRSGGLGLLRDLHDLFLMASEADISWTMVAQAAQGARDGELMGIVAACEEETAGQIRWLRTRMKQAAPQTLVVA